MSLIFMMGCLAFVLFFMGDINDYRLHNRVLCLCFPAGAILLTIAVLLQLSPAAAPVQSLPLRILFSAAALLFAALEIYSLFFAFSAEAAYASPGEKRQAHRTGVYALCRHPGVLWLFLLFLCLWLAQGFPLSALVLYSLLNVLLVIFEDALVFPALLSGYDDYKAKTPFIIPTPLSIKAAFSEKNGIESEENEVSG